MILEAYFPLMFSGISNRTIEQIERGIKSKAQAIAEALRDTFFSGRHPLKYIPATPKEIYRDILARRSAESYGPMVSDKYKELLADVKQREKILLAEDIYLTAIENIISNPDKWKDALLDAFNRIVARRSIISAGMGDALAYDGLAFAINVLCGNGYILGYLRPYDRMLPSKWVINLFGFRSGYMYQRLQTIMKFIAIMIYYDTEMGKPYRSKIIQLLDSYVDKEIRPKVIPKYILHQLTITDSAYSNYGEVVIKVERV